MAFDLQAFVPRVHHGIMDAFLKQHGAGQEIDWQENAETVVGVVLEALKNNSWAIAALENCELIAASGGRDLLRTAGHHRPELMHGVDNIDANDETCAVWLAAHDRDIFDQVVSAAHALKGLGSRSWDAFKINIRAPVVPSLERESLVRFRDAVDYVLRQNTKAVPAYRTLSIDHFEYMVPTPSSHSRPPWTQVNIFAETALRTHHVLVGGKPTPFTLPGLYRASIIFDPARLLIEVVAKGGRPVRDALVDAFGKTLLPKDIEIDRLARRKINFDLFKSRPPFALRADEPVSNCVVDEIRLAPPGSGGGLITLECKRQGQRVRDIYQSAGAWFGGSSPIGRGGWLIIGVRLRLTFKPIKSGQSGRIVTVELRAPLGTTLRENTNADHAVAERLFRRWGIFGSDVEDE